MARKLDPDKLSPEQVVAMATNARDAELSICIVEMEKVITEIESLVDISHRKDVSSLVRRREEAFQKLCHRYFDLATLRHWHGGAVEPAYPPPPPRRASSYTDYFMEKMDHTFLRSNYLHVSDVLVRRAVVDYRRQTDDRGLRDLREKINFVLPGRVGLPGSSEHWADDQLIAETLNKPLTSKFCRFTTRTLRRFYAAQAEVLLLYEKTIPEDILSNLDYMMRAGYWFVQPKARIRYLALSSDPGRVKAYYHRVLRDYRLMLSRGEAHARDVVSDIRLLYVGISRIADRERRQACFSAHKTEFTAFLLHNDLQEKHARIILRSAQDTCGVLLSSIKKRAAAMGMGETLARLQVDLDKKSRGSRAAKGVPPPPDRARVAFLLRRIKSSLKQGNLADVDVQLQRLGSLIDGLGPAADEDSVLDITNVLDDLDRLDTIEALLSHLEQLYPGLSDAVDVTEPEGQADPPDE